MNKEQSSLLKRRGLLIILSSPSGAGKSTLSRLLRDEMAFSLSVSVTTRERRQSEVNGVHYHFISIEDFERKRDNDELIEWAEVHGNYYGTLKKTVEQALADGNDMLFDIDYQGAEQLQSKMGDDIVSIFILPPSMKELKSRLHRRAEDSEEVINLRLDNACREMKHWQAYDYVIINDDLNISFSMIKDILRAEAAKRKRNLYLEDFIHQLISEKRS